MTTTGAGRFAPSPTSDLHLGNLRTALLAWLFARADGLDFIVRIEDLDQQRVAAAPEVARQQLDDLSALGIDHDGPVVRQSQRLHLYRRAAEGLDAYPCFCTRREIAEASQAPNGGPGTASWRPYPGTCAHLSTHQQHERALTREPAIRVRAGIDEFTVHDRLHGDVAGVVDDFVLFRADQTPAYNLAVVVDDGLQGVTQVVRGDDLLDSAPRQAWLATVLGWEVPEYVHVSLALNAAGQRLAKRDGAVTLADCADKGLDAVEVLHVLCRSAGLPEAADARGVLAALTPGQLTQDLVRRPWTAV